MAEDAEETFRQWRHFRQDLHSRSLNARLQRAAGLQKSEHSARFLARVQLHGSLSEPDRADSAERGFSQVGVVQPGTLLEDNHVAAGGRIVSLKLRRFVRCGPDQRGGWLSCRL